jgi:hypothetical protein
MAMRNEETAMKRFWILKGLKMFALLLVALAALGFAVMALWNWVLPPVTGLHAISFAQALALLVLARLLFGSFRGRRHGGWYWRHRMRARFEQMTPEERERFREQLGARGHYCRPGDELNCTGGDAPTSAPAR